MILDRVNINTSQFGHFFLAASDANPQLSDEKANIILENKL